MRNSLGKIKNQRIDNDKGESLRRGGYDAG